MATMATMACLRVGVGRGVGLVGRRPRRSWAAGVLGRRCAAQGCCRSLSARASDTAEQHVSVRCASSGSIVVSLYHVAEHAPTAPLLLYLPPASPQPPPQTDDLQPPPAFLLRRRVPVAVIRYRWQSPGLLWPTPLHDVLFAYDWIRTHLAPPPPPPPPTTLADDAGPFAYAGEQPAAPPPPPRRDLYVFGAQQGGGLAAALALTETHPSRPVALRGVAAYNGIYNWTAFVETDNDGDDGLLVPVPVAADAAAVQRATPGVPALASLFRSPDDLFDPFASPALFFHSAGRLVPPLDWDADVSRRRAREADEEVEGTHGAGGSGIGSGSGGQRHSDMARAATAHKTYYGFPPRQSTLAVPAALLLHTAGGAGNAASAGSSAKAGHERAGRPRARRIPAATSANNSFAVQAHELASLMRRSIDRSEAQRLRGQPPAGDEEEAGGPHRSRDSMCRVQTAAVEGAPDDSLGLGAAGQEALLGWLEGQMGGA